MLTSYGTEPEPINPPSADMDDITQSLQDSASARSLNDMQSRTQELLNLVGDCELETVTDAGGKKWEVLAKPAGSGEINDNSTAPFRVLIKKEGNKWLYMVTLESHLFKDYTSTRQPITGLNTWRNLSGAEQIVFLKVEFATSYPFAPVSASIKTSPADEAFDPKADAWEENSILEDNGNSTTPVHKITRVHLATLTGPSGSEPAKIDQIVSSHLRAEDASVDGRSCRIIIGI